MVPDAKGNRTEVNYVCFVFVSNNIMGSGKVVSSCLTKEQDVLQLRQV